MPGSGEGVPGSEKPLPVRGGGALGSENARHGQSRLGAARHRDTPFPEVFA